MNLTSQPTANRTVSLDSSVVAKRDLLCCDVNEEAIILDTASGTYFGLDPVGSRIWSIMQSPTSLAELRDVLVAEFDVAPSVCEAELLAFVRDLLSRDLVEVHA